MLIPCVGRDDVIAELARLVDTHRWVTLTGAPGCGKTLVARHAVAEKPRTVWVTARPATTRETLALDALDALGVELVPGESPTKALKRSLDGQELVLVLDGVDGVDGLGELLSEMVDEADTWRLLCTAQTVAGRPHERVLRLQPLPCPEDGGPFEGPALELLLGRVATAGGQVVDIEQHEPILRRLLAASGGLPLLLEQLAVQIAFVGVADVSPVGSMDEAVRASYDLLDEQQQRCFRRVAVVGRPMSLEVLAEVCGVSRAEAVQLAGALSRRSLLEVHADGRFNMLAPLRQVGRALAEAAGDTRAALDGLVAWVDRVLPPDFMTGASNQRWLSELDLVDMAIRHACSDDGTRAKGYELANRAFSSLYTAMRAREAAALLESVVDSGDGPPLIGSQLARRAGICASEARGTFAGLRLIDRAEEHAAALEPGQRAVEVARSAAIRAEMHLDAGELARARAEAQRALDCEGDTYVVRQARRTLMDVCTSAGDWEEAEQLATLIVDSPPEEELWIALSARTLQAKIAWEQGRVLEAQSLAQFARDQSTAIHEDRIALLADTMLRQVTGSPAADAPTRDIDLETLPWAVRMVVALQDVRDLLAAGEVERAAGRAADIVVLADSGSLGRDAVEARLLVADALMLLGEPSQAQLSYLSVVRRGSAMPLPTRVADALDGLAHLVRTQGGTSHRQLAGAAAALRAPRGAVGRSRPGVEYAAGAARDCPSGWVRDGQLTQDGVSGVAALFEGGQPELPIPLQGLTKAEFGVAKLVAEGLTSRQIAERLFVSPRTVDAHLSHIYRKLDIGSRARLAALMSEVA